MVTPITSESEWLLSLEKLPQWGPPLTPTLLVAPHPDDETLGAGGLIAALRSQGIAVSVVAVTDGENAYPDSPDSAPQLAIQREQEQTEALACLGVPAACIHRLQLTDSAVSTNEAHLTELLNQLITPHTHVLAPWPGDFHPDHEACGRAAQTAARAQGALLTFYFFWTWHRGTTQLLEDLPLVAFPLTQQAREARQKALLCHRSQLERPGGDPILPDYLLEPASRPFEVFLPS